MPNKDIFCSSPWNELHIYWDGGLGFCCQESHRVYDQDLRSVYNVKNMSIQQWYDSEPMRKARMAMFSDHKTSFCKMCYHEEAYHNTSRRHKTNQKVAIFTKSALQESYQQSPFFQTFESSRLNDGEYHGMPIDLHINLGNYCNLSCKMCNPYASSQIASRYVKWGFDQYQSQIGTDWTSDDDTWYRVLDELASIGRLRNVHFMGGETLITSRFEDFVDFMSAKGRYDLNFSFVTNGTVYNQNLIDKLKKFSRVGIEVSMESWDSRNEYVRQGTDNKIVKTNLEKYLEQCDGSSISLTVRPSISALTIGTYFGLLEYCLDKKLVVKSNIVTNPRYLDARILPSSVREKYKESYQSMINDYDLEHMTIGQDYNESDSGQYKMIIKSQIDMILGLLSSPELPDSEKQLSEMTSWCKRWDSVYGYDATEIYPELKEILLRHGYHV